MPLKINHFDIDKSFHWTWTSFSNKPHDARRRGS